MAIPRSRKLLPVAASLAGAIVCGVIVVSSGVTERGSATSEAVTLPGACANFEHASRTFAREGSAAVVRFGGGISGQEMFALDAEAYAADVLQALLASCDEELEQASR
jgi:hypothetical protein